MSGAAASTYCLVVVNHIPVDQPTDRYYSSLSMIAGLPSLSSTIKVRGSCQHESRQFSCGLFVINLGIAFGAGLYEHRIVVPRWVTADDSGGRWNADAVRRDNTGLRFWAYVTTGPLTLLTLANLLAAWKTIGTVRTWWLAAALLAMADRVLTFSYFIPTIVGLMNAADSTASVAAATRWAHLNYLRHGLVLGGWLAALKTFSLLYRNGAHD